MEGHVSWLAQFVIKDALDAFKELMHGSRALVRNRKP